LPKNRLIVYLTLPNFNDDSTLRSMLDYIGGRQQKTSQGCLAKHVTWNTTFQYNTKNQGSTSSNHKVQNLL